MTTTELYNAVGRAVKKAKRVPVVINYSVGGVKYQKTPDESDLAVLHKIDLEPIPGWFPTKRIDGDIDLWYQRDYRSLGIYSVDAFFLSAGRSLWSPSFTKRLKNTQSDCGVFFGSGFSLS